MIWKYNQQLNKIAAASILYFSVGNTKAKAVIATGGFQKKLKNICPDSKNPFVIKKIIINY